MRRLHCSHHIMQFPLQIYLLSCKISWNFCPCSLTAHYKRVQGWLHTTRWDQTSTQPKVPFLSLSHLVQAGLGNGANRCPGYPQWSPSLSHPKHRAFFTRGRDFAFHTHMGFCLAWICSATCLKSCEGLTFIWFTWKWWGFFGLKAPCSRICWVVPSTSTAFLGKKIAKLLFVD